MDSIILYTKSELLKTKVNDIRFDYMRKVEILVLDDSEAVMKVLKTKPQSFVIVIKENLSESDLLFVRSIQVYYERVKIALFSNRGNALLAWELEVFDFKSFPVRIKTLQSSYRKYINSFGIGHTIGVKTKEGIIKLPTKNVNFIKADGNYSELYLTTGKKQLVSKQLHYFEKIVAGSGMMKRINRSYILNVKNIKSLNNGVVSFVCGDTILKLSRDLSRKVKNEYLN